MNSPIGPKNTSGASDFGKLLADCPAESLSFRVDALRKKLELRGTFLGSYQIFAQYLKLLIERGKPASIIRLADGEGIFLAHRIFPKFEALLGRGRQRSLPHFFGQFSQSFTQKKVLEVADLLLEAICGSDIVGINYYKIDPYRNIIDIGEDEAARAYLGWASSILATTERLDTSTQALSSCFLHLWLLDCLWPIVEQLVFIGTVHCDSSIQKLISRKFPQAEVVHYLIPPRGADDFSTGNICHYPDHFNSVCDSFVVPFTGAIFLVGAGPLGKAYCMKLKEAGAIAIDVGSNFDLWLGKRSRHWHSDARSSTYTLIS